MRADRGCPIRLGHTAAHKEGETASRSIAGRTAQDQLLNAAADEAAGIRSEEAQVPYAVEYETEQADKLAWLVARRLAAVGIQAALVRRAKGAKSERAQRPDVSALLKSSSHVLRRTPTGWKCEACWRIFTRSQLRHGEGEVEPCTGSVPSWCSVSGDPRAPPLDEQSAQQTRELAAKVGAHVSHSVSVANDRILLCWRCGAFSESLRMVGLRAPCPGVPPNQAAADAILRLRSGRLAKWRRRCPDEDAKRRRCDAINAASVQQEWTRRKRCAEAQAERLDFEKRFRITQKQSAKRRIEETEVDLTRRLRQKTPAPVAPCTNFELCDSDGREDQAEIVNTEISLCDQMILDAWSALRGGSFESESPDDTDMWDDC